MLLINCKLKQLYITGRWYSEDQYEKKKILSWTTATTDPIQFPGSKE